MGQRTRSGNISLGQLINYLRNVKMTGMSSIYEPLSNHDIEMAKSALYHINKLRKLLRGFNERLKKLENNGHKG